MDEQEVSGEGAGDGIYGICSICWCLTPNLTGHMAWHESRGEVVGDAHE